MRELPNVTGMMEVFEAHAVRANAHAVPADTRRALPAGDDEVI